MNAPSSFICPLTLDVMADPLVSRAGHSFERSAILEWLDRGNTCCPLTRRPMKISDLISHRALKTEIQEWRSDHGEAEESSSEDHSDYVICMDLQDEEMAARFNAKRSITPPHSSQKAGISSRSRRLRLNSSLSRARPSRSIIRTLRD
jgi:hypothetical protein